MENQSRDIARLKEELERREMMKMADQQLAENCVDVLEQALSDLRNAKPKERSEKARRFAVTITELEKVIAYFIVYVVNADDDELT